MITSIKHTVTASRTKNAIILPVVVVAVLFYLISLGTGSLINDATNTNHSSAAKSSGSRTEVSTIPFHQSIAPLPPAPGIPWSDTHDEDMIEPESLQDDDISEALIFIAASRADHSLEESRQSLSPGALAIRPTISLIILHHSWKMHLC